MGKSHGVPSFGLRIAGAFAAFAILATALAVVMLCLEALGATEATVVAVGKAFTYCGFGALVIGWRWPYALLGPAVRLFDAWRAAAEGRSDRGRGLLGTSIQRALFAGGIFALVPWLFMRVVRELWRSAGVEDYLRSVLVAPLSPWFEAGWWWYTKLEWFDWPVLPGLAALALAFSWPYTGGLIVAWIRNGK